jgi:hypothetical protein
MARTPAALVKQKQAQALRLLAGGASYQHIADRLGYTNRGAAWRLVQNGLARQVDERAEEYLQLEGDRLDCVHRSFWRAATVDLDVAAARIVLEAIEQRCKLLGLNGEIKGRRPSALNPAPHGIVLSPKELVDYYSEQLTYAEAALSEHERRGRRIGNQGKQRACA